MKQYLMMCNESGMQVMQFLFKEQGVQFLEIQGMAMAGNNVNILVTPILPPVTPMPQAVETLPPPPPEVEIVE